MKPRTFGAMLLACAVAFFGAYEATANGGYTWLWETAIPSATGAQGVITNAAGWGFNVRVTDIGAKALEIGVASKAPDVATTLDFTGDIEGDFLMRSTRDFEGPGYGSNHYSVLQDSTGVFGGVTVDFKNRANALVLPDTLEIIGVRAFSQCSFLRGTLEIPASVTNIKDTAFHTCSGFSGTLRIPGNVKTVGTQPFGGMFGGANRTTLIIEHGVESIGANAFNGCQITNNVIIPASMKTLGGSVFLNCGLLPAVTFLGAKPATSGNIYSITTVNVITYVTHDFCEDWENDKGYSNTNLNFRGDLAYLNAYWHDRRIYCDSRHPLMVYTVKFDGNGNIGGAMADQIITIAMTTNLTANGFTRSGYDFVGWTNLVSGGTMYANEALVTDIASAGDTITLSALWEQQTYTVTFDGDGETGGTMGVQTIARNVLTALTVNDFTKTGYDFMGWTNLVSGGEILVDEQEVTNLAPAHGNVTLTAVWEKVIPDAEDEWVFVTAIDVLPNGDVDLTLDDSKICVNLKTVGYVYVVYATTDLTTPFVEWDTYVEGVDVNLLVTPRSNPVHIATLIGIATDATRFFRVKAEGAK